MPIRIMTTQEYATEIMSKHTKSKTCSQQYIRRLISQKKELPQVVRIIKVSDYYNLLEVEQ